jgi:hypothetical protein
MIADALGWTLEEFYGAFAECWRSMLVDADFDVGLIFVIDATANDPWHVNQRKGWAVAVDKLPDCELKTVAREVVLSRGKAPSDIYARWRSARLSEPHSTSVNLSEPHSTSVNLSEVQSTSVNLSEPHSKKPMRLCRWGDTGIAPSLVSECGEQSSESVKLDTFGNRNTHARAHARGRTRARAELNCNNLNLNSDRNTDEISVAPEAIASGTSASALAVGKQEKASKETKPSSRRKPSAKGKPPSKEKPPATPAQRSIERAREMQKAIPTIVDDRPSSPDLFSLPSDKRRELYNYLATDQGSKPENAKRREMLERACNDVLRVYLNFRVSVSVSGSFAYSDKAKAIEWGQMIGLGCIGNGMTPEQYIEWWTENDYTENEVPTLAFLSAYSSIEKAAANLLSKGNRVPRKRGMREVDSGDAWKESDDDLAALEARVGINRDGTSEGGEKSKSPRRPRKKEG